MRAITLAIIATLMTTSFASAAPKRITKEADFRAMIVGRNLVADFGTVRSNANGTMSGSILGAKIIGGAWNWQQGFYCRVLKTSKSDFPSNCQIVRIDGTTVTFTSDQGKGSTSTWTLK